MSTHDEIVDYQYCTGVPFRDGMEYCYSEITLANLDLIMLIVTILISCGVILAWATVRHHD